jgi:hypothetical protein
VLDHVTPAQAELLMEAIAARRREALEREIAVIRLAVWGDERQLSEVQRALAAADEREDAQALAAMGVAVTRRSQGGPGSDDGQPAG